MQQNSTSTTKKTIYLIRHGQTDFNQRGIVQGSGVDSDLNETGRLQALRFYETYKHIPFSDIFISTLKRTYQTVAPFFDKKIPLHTFQELDEINWGELEGKEPTEENTRMFMQMLQRWSNGELDVAIAGGETPKALFERQQTALAKIESIQKEHPILICMHGRAMRSFLSLLTCTPLQNMDEYEHGNTCLYILEKESHENCYTILKRNLQNHL